MLEHEVLKPAIELTPNEAKTNGYGCIYGPRDGILNSGYSKCTLESEFKMAKLMRQYACCLHQNDQNLHFIIELTSVILDNLCNNALYTVFIDGVTFFDGFSCEMRMINLWNYYVMHSIKIISKIKKILLIFT